MLTMEGQKKKKLVSPLDSNREGESRAKSDLTLSHLDFSSLFFGGWGGVGVPLLLNNFIGLQGTLMLLGLFVHKLLANRIHL